MRRCALCDHEEAAHVEGEGCCWSFRTGSTMSWETHVCACPGFVERDRPALQLSLGESPWSTVERQLEEALDEIKQIKGRR